MDPNSVFSHQISTGLTKRDLHVKVEVRTNTLGLKLEESRHIPCYCTTYFQSLGIRNVYYCTNG
jgi:hypothetical protein